MERVNLLGNKLKVLLAGMVFNFYWLIAVWGQYRFTYILVFILIATWFMESKAWRFSVLASIPGIVIDSMLRHWQMFDFPIPNRMPLFFNVESIGLIPTWLILLWLGFTTFVWVLRSSINGFATHWLLVAGSLGGALSYWSGMKLGSVIWQLETLDTFFVLIVIWFAVTAYLLWLLRVLNKEPNNPTAKEQ